ncbi:MAG TPA: sigma-54 dependent transcriptional regulator [Syntrophorhabdaceae bacterium]|nr:sigma-54 dependent transcriptional regulator [Syntrophorhabdaceae bacterium]HOL05374.1 sigma-54 dependent transcriptional regulator [Syntrophorhabdaceae bacterium]HON85027.1 sigma-54 dependent transcriptional regulator [Syntrophorhabdaceae bacterium]HOT41554.1 sigma-54 dependent transcriptional regulator [Syntrophorhabdaceae bacterium]HPC65852.1 sigma-54 dependent transcriptional regulator [Syntrophorhabdaceae bacterium]
MNKADILVVEDEHIQRTLLSEFLAKEGFQVFSAESGATAREVFRDKAIDIVLLDFKLPDTDGLSLIRYFKEINPEVEIIMITAFGSIENAVSALKAGASEYLTKPVDLDDLLFKIKKIEDRLYLIRENMVLKETLKERFKTEEFVYSSEKMQEVASLIVRVARTDSTCLITGESGTGKEVVANLIHALSSRKDQPLVKVNCSAIPENLLESELFGYEKGAFTGAVQRKMGKFELADKGTIFLDEIGDMPLILQSKLLRVIQEREIERLGGLHPIKIDVRIIAATNRNLEEEVKYGNFREDLYYRLNVVKIELPSLKERKNDIPILIDFFLKKYNDRHKKGIKGISKEARDIMIKYDFPGNVRELENIMERAVVLARGEYITTEDLSISQVKPGLAKDGSIKDVVGSIERDMIIEALKKNNWVQTKAAASLGMSERVLRYKMNKYGISK